MPGHPQHTMVRSSSSALGGAANVYTILQSAQDQVMYDPATNVVVFGHRQDPAAFGGQGGSGTLRFDVSTDGGGTWTVNKLLTPGIYTGSADSIIGARYPSTTLYDPPGNTDPANVFVVSSGMTLNWPDSLAHVVNTGLLQRSSAHLDGSAVTNTFDDLFGDRTTYNTLGLCTKADGTLWTLAGRQSNSTHNADTVTFKEFPVCKGVWNAGQQRVDWSVVTTLTPATLVYNDPALTGTKFAQVNTWNMGFAPDGQVGYCVILGKEYNTIHAGPMPLVWKTTDGGDTWYQLPDHDFGAEPWMMDNIYPASDNDEIRPYFADMDMTVDATGKLHIVADLLSQYYGNAPDSVNYIFTALASQFVVHLSTEDGVSWAIDKLSDKYNADYEYPVLNLTTGPNQTYHPQASRTADGSHVFFTWNRSGEGDAELIFPEIHGAALNVTTGLWAGPKSLSAASDADGVAWWHTVSPICISNGDDLMYELPIVFADPDAYADLASGFRYLKGIGFDETEFTVGIEEAQRSGRVRAYPNPGSGLFQLSFTDIGPADLQVVDANGRVVRTGHLAAPQATLDLSGEGPGLYALVVTTAHGRFTERLVVQ